ncbi:hypothetical protein DNH61_11795 [Paenibacillus sambharensis]|uniref:Uncharacterized protein n=1 Tax=Paenibacillus sambharensis TaxID=1803190 RepID=A0A2W1L7I4_9BACL|nr:hypothetical protein DNH61_11795 [Paenibacillus sambharensis]
MQRPPKAGDTMYCPLCEKSYYRFREDIIPGTVLRGSSVEPIGDAELPQPGNKIECPVHHLPFEIRGGE